MSPEHAPIETINKAQAVADLEQAAATSDMSNEQYEATRASIESAHLVRPLVPEEIAPEARELAEKYESRDDSKDVLTGASAQYAEQQRAAAKRALDLAAASPDSMDEDRYQAILKANTRGADQK